MVKRLKVRGDGGHADRGGEEECAGTSLRPTFPGENSITVVQEIAQKTAFASDVQRCWDWTRKRLDEKWTRTPCKANICHRWRVDGMLIRTQGYKSFKPIHPNWAVVGKRWNHSAVAF